VSAPAAKRVPRRHTPLRLHAWGPRRRRWPAPDSRIPKPDGASHY